MPITGIASGIAGSANHNDVTVSGLNTTGASLLVAFVASEASGSGGTFSDNKGNTWASLTLYTGTGSPQVQFYYCKNPTTVGSGHSFTYSGSGRFPGMQVAAYAGTDRVASPVASSGAGSTASTIQPGSVNPGSLNGCLFITGVGSKSTATVSINSGFTILDQTPFSTGAYYGVAVAHNIQTSAAALNPTWNITTSTDINSAIVIFQPALDILDTTLPDGVTNKPYSKTLTPAGGTGSITWAVTSGSLPNGITLNASTGVLSGSPTLAGTYSFTITATDSLGSTDSQAFTLTVADFVSPFGDQLSLVGMEISDISLKVERLKADFGQGYGASATVGSGSGLWGWQIESDALPDSTDYGNLISGLPRFQYYEKFYRDHTEGDSSEVFIVDFRGKKYHACFDTDSIAGSMHTYDLFSLSGVSLKMRRLPGVIYNDDGSIFEPDAWIRSDAITGKVDAGSMVGAWSDFNGGVSWDVASDGTTPTYETNEVNSLPVVRLTAGHADLTGALGVYDVFLVVKVSEATFSAARGVLADSATDFLIGTNATTKFADPSDATAEYRLNGTLYANSNRQAPMNAFGIVHLRKATAFNFVTRVRIGKSVAGGAGKIDIAEAILCTTQISAKMFARITSVLKTRYGIA